MTPFVQNCAVKLATLVDPLAILSILWRHLLSIRRQTAENCVWFVNLSQQSLLGVLSTGLITSELVCLPSLFLAKVLPSNTTLPSLQFSTLSVSLYPRFASYCEYRISLITYGGKGVIHLLRSGRGRRGISLLISRPRGWTKHMTENPLDKLSRQPWHRWVIVPGLIKYPDKHLNFPLFFTVSQAQWWRCSRCL